MSAPPLDPLAHALGPWLATEHTEPLQTSAIAASVAEMAMLILDLAHHPQGTLSADWAQKTQALRTEITTVLAQLGNPSPPEATRGAERTGEAARHAVLRGTIRRVLQHLQTELDRDTPAPPRPLIAAEETTTPADPPMLKLLTFLFLLTRQTPPVTEQQPLHSTMLALWLTDVDPATRARMLACMLERANEGDCTVLSDASRVSRPEELERFNLWPLTTDRLRPWLTHPQRAVRETGLRLVGYLQTAAPREQEPAREPGPEAAPPPRKRPRPRR